MGPFQLVTYVHGERHVHAQHLHYCSLQLGLLMSIVLQSIDLHPCQKHDRELYCSDKIIPSLAAQFVKSEGTFLGD